MVTKRLHDWLLLRQELGRQATQNRIGGRRLDGKEEVRHVPSGELLLKPHKEGGNILLSSSGTVCSQEPVIPGRKTSNCTTTENLPVVPACEVCNGGASLDEEYFACLLECTLAGSADSAAVRRTKIRQILQRKPVLAAMLTEARTVSEGGTLFLSGLYEYSWGVRVYNMGSIGIVSRYMACPCDVIGLVRLNRVQARSNRDHFLLDFSTTHFGSSAEFCG